jgi:hypothetical protein
LIQLEELEQARAVSQTSHEQNVSNTVAISLSTAATTGNIGSSVNDYGIVSRGVKRANDELISDQPSPKRLAADDSPSR